MIVRMTRPVAGFTAASMLFGLVLAGCDIFTPTVGSCSTAPVEGIAVVVGNRANSPAPAVPQALADQLPALIELSRKTKKDKQATVGVNVIRVDGRPTISCVVRLNVDTENKPAETKAEEDFRNDIATRVQEARAQTGEADVLTALSLGSSSVGKNGTVILVDSGLQTVKPLNFVEPNLVGAEPDQILERLVSLSPLPDLSGRTLILSGIGYTALPQMPLHEGQRQLLVRFWEALARKAGAKDVIVVPEPNTSKSADGLPSVTPVPVPDVGTVKFACNSQTVLRNDGKVGFVPDRTDLLDRESALRTLTELANFLSGNNKATVTLIGNVAHYGSKNGTLAYRRAVAVKDLLVQLGVAGSRINAVGDGWGPHPDRNAGPDPAFDQQNRRVVVVVSCA